MCVTVSLEVFIKKKAFILSISKTEMLAYGHGKISCICIF